MKDNAGHVSAIHDELKRFKRDILFCWFVLCAANVLAITGMLFLFFRE